ncbi:hypothetical protein LX81_02892 [Palleronia aestuarii]|uniref:Bartonella effector protein BID domain-containing protein n=1 Tax=Palleronia aestuarii TaxID=568105 RepID=A0A2W7PXN4_9RHOB|nr:hypothetical protein LX81_02892 [Palleronia aestuarii]
MKTHGTTSAARRIEAEPEQLGPLLGRTGLLAGRAARQTRAQAARVAEAVGSVVRRIGEVESAAARSYEAGVAARRVAEATGVPVLSENAQAAVRSLRAVEAPDARSLV